VIETRSAAGLRLLAHSDLGGYGDGMQVLREGDALYVGHFGPSGMGTSILDVSDPAAPRIVEQIPAPPGTHTHKVQVADGLLLVNEEQFRGGEPYEAGMVVYDVAGDPFAPRRIGRYEPGGLGVHRIVWTGGRYAHASAIPEGYDDRIWVVVDLSDPTSPVEAARYVLDEPQPEGHRYAAHHALLDGDVAYLGYDDAGMVVLDVSDMTAPRKLARIDWQPGGATHTCLPLPGRDLVVVTDEQQKDGLEAPTRLVRVVDVADQAAPRVVSVLPEPERLYDDLRYGPHNLHENRAGSYRSERLVFVTYFNAGLRVYDLEDPAHPVEVAHWVPEPPPGQAAPQVNDLFVESGGLIWATDRYAGGVFALEPEPALAELLDAARLAG
jgi:hypothetical protein